MPAMQQVEMRRLRATAQRDMQFRHIRKGEALEDAVGDKATEEGVPRVHGAYGEEGWVQQFALSHVRFRMVLEVSEESGGLFLYENEEECVLGSSGGHESGNCGRTCDIFCCVS